MTAYPHNLCEITARYTAAVERMELAWAKYCAARHEGKDADRRSLYRYVRRLRICDRLRAALEAHMKGGTL